MVRFLLAICLFTGPIFAIVVPSRAAGVPSMSSVPSTTVKEKQLARASSYVKNSMSTADTAILMKAAAFADSAYYSNINGTYSKTIAFSDSCRRWLNELYLRHTPNGKLLMLKEGDVSKMPPEVRWLHDSLPTNYRIIMDVRNETGRGGIGPSPMGIVQIQQQGLYDALQGVFRRQHLRRILPYDAKVGDQ